MNWLLLFFGGISCLHFTNAESKYYVVDSTPNQLKRFPDGFQFGVATAAYQVEGAWNIDGKGENIWDHATHNEAWRIEDGTNADVTDDSYHHYKRDVQMMRELGVDFYRFSISWSRLLPTGFSYKINEKAVEYYNNLIDELIKHNITPMVTMYHWDLPQNMQVLGGWVNPMIVDWFEDYARFAVEKFGDRVKIWSTFNEPFEFCNEGYGSGANAPFLKFKGIPEYICAYNVVKSHAKVWHLYDEEFRQKQNGKLGIVISTPWFEPASDSPEDIQAAEDARQFNHGLFSHPIFAAEGNFPPELKSYIDKKSKEQGFTKSRLPELTPEEILYIRGSSDYYGFNHYTTYVAYRNASVPVYPIPSWEDDSNLALYQNPSWPTSASSWLKVVPYGIRKSLNYIKDEYNSPEILITENGFSTKGGLNDDDRVSYYRSYLNAVLDAIHEDDVNVTAYAAWSLMDNFEWTSGYKERFGLYEVDFESPNRTRTARKSALVYKQIIQTGIIDYDHDVTSSDISID